MRGRIRRSMSDETGPADAPRVSQRFSEVEDELRREDTLLSLFKEQWVGMSGMAGMFVVTIALAMYMRPYYDVGELHAFGASGATQVRYVAIELLAIFVFTALIITLAKYKKDWIIKYGMMGVLTLAMLYSTIPLAHVMLIDFEPEPYVVDSTDELQGDYLGEWGDSGFITAELIGEGGDFDVIISAWDVNQGLDAPVWNMTHDHSTYDDLNRVRMVTGDGELSFTSGEWSWVLDSATGELLHTYACHELSEDGEPQPFLQIRTGCELAVKTDDAIYYINSQDELFRYNTFEVTPEFPEGQIFQAKWAIPDLDIRDGLVRAELLDDEHLFIVSTSMSTVLFLETSSGGIENISTATLLYTQNSASTFTSADIGVSPFSTTNISMTPSNQRMLLTGQSDGTITGVEWNGSAVQDEQFVLQSRMMLDNLVTHVSSLQITDLDEDGFTDLLIADTTEAHWLFTTSLVDRGVFPVAEDALYTFFNINEDTTKLVSVAFDIESMTITIEQGDLVYEMFPLYGIQLETVPTLIGLAVTVILMILLFVHSEWYVVNTTGVLLGAGVCVMLGVTFVPGLAILFMILAAIYDGWAVYKSKHMLDLADTMIGLRLPILLVAPQDKGYSLIEETDGPKSRKKMSDKPKPTKSSKKGREAMFMGLGDVIFPGMLVLSAMQWLDESVAFSVAMTTLLGGLMGYLALMTYVARGKAQAGLPLLNGGAILGYLIGGLFFVGTGIFQFNITW